MVTKTITVEGIGPLHFGSREDYNDFLISEGVKCLMENKVRQGYDTLVQNSTYTLGPPIRQQQQNPMAAARVADDRSREIYSAWGTELRTLPAPSREALKAAVEAALPTPIPVPPHHMPAYMPYGRDVLTASQDGAAPLDPELERLRGNILRQERLGRSEDSLHAVVDNLILMPMKFVASHMNIALRIDRNSADPSGATVRSLRPDVLVWLPSGVLAFKGEDKATAAELYAARHELSTKVAVFTDTFFGGLQYQLCYALGGEMLQFCAILRRDNVGRHELVPLTDVVNLSEIQGRSLCVRYVVNITRLLVAMHRSEPFGSVMSLGDTVTSPSSVVHILGDHVVKKPLLYSGWEVLEPLYALLKESGNVPGLIRVYKSPKQRGDHVTLYLAPVGLCGIYPRGVDEVKAAGRRILLALQFLHSRGWVHRDIRPWNAMFADQSWYLVDLEWANTAHSELGNFCPADEWTPPEISSSNCRWTCACDMWQFGRLIGVWGSLDEDGRAYMRVQSDDNPNMRLSADASLRHAFFA